VYALYMSRTLCAAGVVGALVWGSPCIAAGFNIAWGECGLHGNSNEDFACDTNSGMHDFVVSFVAPQGITSLQYIDVVLTLEIDGQATLPEWWQVNLSAGCRQQAMNISLDFTGGSCLDYWASKPHLATWVITDPSILGVPRLEVIAYVPEAQASGLIGGAEYYAFRATIDNRHTVGDTTCAGCNLPATIAVRSISLNQTPSLPNFGLTSAADRGEIRWQGSSVPTRTSTWGLVKSLYRR
jgi:hypothetical protein